MLRLLQLAFLASAFATPSLSAAEESSTEGERPFDSAVKSAEAGVFNPFSQPASIEGRGSITILSGYDSSYGAAALNANAEARVWGPVAVRAGMTWVAQKNTIAPTAGLRVQALRQAAHGIDLSVGAQYKPEGLTESSGEGEIEAIVAVARHMGRLSLLGNAVYGQDFEANDRDGELRISGIYTVTDRFHFGLDSRVRFDLGSARANVISSNKATLDIVAGPMASYLVGPVAIVGTVGYAGVSLASNSHYSNGAIAMGGIGAAF